ncbi:hypothetical protein MPSEU_000422000 [Mayamaea pseudoterrestris]|nr:hypothetical protein MPSEU_000422000 [Mayamaea pseudoterrestris]
MNNKNNMSDEDAKIKARAASGRPSTQPGATSSTAAAASASLARLDQRLAEKLAKEQQRPSSSSNYNTRAQLESLEGDVQAKVTGSHRAAAMRPGVESVSGESADPVAAKIRRDTQQMSKSEPTELQHLEAAIQAKVQGNSKQQQPQRPQELYSLEDQVQAKIRRDGNNGPSLAAAASSNAPYGSSGNNNNMSTLDQRIAAKMAANPTAFRNDDDDLDDDDDEYDRKLPAVASNTGNGLNSGKMASIGGVSSGNYPSNNKSIPEQAKEQQSDRRSNNRNETLGRPEQTQPDVEYGVMDMAGASGLAIAVAVQDDDDDMFIPSAVEYDPDAKPPMYRHRRFRLYALLAFFVVIVVAVGAAVGATVGSKNMNMTESPTMAPTTIRESFGIRTQVERLVGAKVLEKEDSAYSKALDWMTFDDPMQLTPDADNFSQRYIAAYFYFATSEDGPWLSCAPPKDAWTDGTECQYKELSAIFPVQYFEVPWNRWLSNISECQWAGVTCDEHGQVRGLDLSGNELSGPVPEGMVHFPYLQSISISWTNLRGTLPVELSEMKQLNSIELHYNQITGTVPIEWYKMRSLQHLNLGDNMISGSVPTEIANLLDLKSYFFFTNMITGSIPTEVGVLNSMAYFRVSRNALTGSFPSEAFSWRSIEEIWLHRNQLTGTISTDFGRLTSLNDMRFQANPLVGTIPTEIYSLPNLERLDLWDCQLTGTIATEIGLLSDHFYTLRVSGNQFRGTLPQEMANLTEISEIWIEGNAFTGTVPEALCALEDKVDYTLETFSADCLVDSATGAAEISCPTGCCTTCCRADGTGCLETDSGV